MTEAVSALDVPLLQAQDIRKRFGETYALRGVDLELRQGEFVGLMGPNGAGKSTLIKILSGVYEADSGSMRIRGKIFRNLANHSEIGFVHQDLGLVDSMSVLDNLRLGAQPLRIAGPVLHRGREIRSAYTALERVGLNIPLRVEVGTLSPGAKAMLAVARLLDRGAQLLVVDETTSTLPPKESRWFIETLRNATTNGTTVLMVSHKLSEIMSVAERMVMLIDGVVAADRPVTAEDSHEVVRLLASHEETVASSDSELAPATQQGQSLGPALLTMRGVEMGSVGPINIEIRGGEIVGITGLVGSGLHTVGLLAAGFSRPESGQVLAPHEVRTAFVAPQRETQGCIPELSVLWNATLASLPKWRRSGRFLSLKNERSDADATLRKLNVTPARSDLPIGVLSGGNQQKVLFSRALLQEATFFVLCEPTRGVDVQTRQEIYRVIRGLKDSGCGVFIVTSDSEDLFAVCDRVATLSQDGLSQFWAASEMTEESLASVL